MSTYTDQVNRFRAGDWVLVPCVPTDAMLRAAQSAWLNDTLRRTTTLWQAMLAAAPQQPAGVGGVPQAWISDNDLMKLHESVDEARNIRMSVRRTNTRVHPIYIPALAALQGGRDDG